MKKKAIDNKELILALEELEKEKVRFIIIIFDIKKELNYNIGSEITYEFTK